MGTLVNIGMLELAIDELEEFGEKVVMKENGDLFEERPVSGELKPISREAVIALRKKVGRDFWRLEKLAKGRVDGELLCDTFEFRRRLRKATEDMLSDVRNAEILYSGDNDVRVVVKEEGCADEEYPVDKPCDLSYISTMVCDGEMDDLVEGFVKKNEDEFWNLRERWLTYRDFVKDAPSELKVIAQPFIGKELGMSY